jgi:hypothetical protein
MENQHTNIIIINVPLRFDRNDFSIVNEETRALNMKLNTLVEKFKNINVWSVALSRKYCTRYKTHMKNKGKENIVNRLTDRIMSVKCKHETVKMISLIWKDNLATNAKVLQVVDTPTISNMDSK